MLDKSILKLFVSELTSMRVRQATTLKAELAKQAQDLGKALARLRLARGVKQHDAALRAGLSRNTAYRLERGDPGIALGQILRYLDAITPGKSLLELLSESDPALTLLRAKETRHRVRELTQAELEKLDF
jgi:transcriptional regulator with XRE-family HTH domain